MWICVCVQLPKFLLLPLHHSSWSQSSLMNGKQTSWSRKWVGKAVSSCILSLTKLTYVSVQFSSVTQSCPALCDPMNRSTPGLPVHHHLPEFTQTHAHRVSDAIQPSHPLSPLLLLPPTSQGELNQG